MRVLVLFMQLRKTTMQHGCMLDSITVLLIPLWKLSFLHTCAIFSDSYILNDLCHQPLITV